MEKEGEQRQPWIVSKTVRRKGPGLLYSLRQGSHMLRDEVSGGFADCCMLDLNFHVLVHSQCKHSVAEQQPLVFFESVS